MASTTQFYEHTSDDELSRLIGRGDSRAIKEAGHRHRLAQARTMLTEFEKQHGRKATSIEELTVFNEGEHMSAKTFPVGTRVRLIQAIDHFPTVCVNAGETGTVDHYTDETLMMVKMDRHFPALDEWNNCLEITDWDRVNGEGDDRFEDQVERIEMESRP